MRRIGHPMATQEGIVQSKEEGELTSTPEAIETERAMTGHTTENSL